MKRTKVLVLGGSGFLGSNLLRYFSEKGYQVRSFSRSLPEERLENVEYITGDFFDDEAVRNAVSGQDVIFHAISSINPGNSNQAYMLGYENDFIKTVRLCELLQKNGARLVFLSSGGTVYGNQETIPISENALPHPINHYGNLKLCMENTMLAFSIQGNLDVRIARISNPYGPGQDYRKGVGFIDAAVRKTLDGECIHIWGDGQIIRDYVYIDDVCGMLELLIDHEGPERVFNIGSGVGTSQNDIIGILKELDPGVTVNYEPGRSVDARAVVLDCSRIQKLYVNETLHIRDGILKYYGMLKRRISVK